MNPLRLRFARQLIAMLVFANLSLFTGLHAEVRTLTDKQGRSIKADVIAVSGDQVKIKRDDGQTFNIPLNSLSEADQTALKAWSEAEVSKTLPTGALEVTLSRGIFKTTKTDEDVKLTSGETIKNGRTTTEEKWGYSVTLTNKTPKPIENLRTEYRLFATVDDVHTKEKQGLKKKAFTSQIEALPELSKSVFKTETISAIKMKYNGNIVSAKTGDTRSRETLYGIWIRIYRGTELVYESAMPDLLRSSEQW